MKEEIYYSVQCHDFFGKNKKDAAGEQVEQMIYYVYIIGQPQKAKTRWRNIVMAWIDYKQVYDTVPQSCIRECLKMYNIFDWNIKSGSIRTLGGKENY